jgi:MOSC domain-containing protein YiiM
MSKTAIKGRILEVRVSLAKDVPFDGRWVSTGIFKTPVTGPVHLGTLNLDGDQQADLTVHGGPDKALYTYASEHYPWWRARMPDVEFPYGKFGENLTTEGLLESQIFIGDEFQAGSAIIRVTQPRLPCYKLGIKFGRADVIKTFMKSSRSGIYFAVVEEGVLGVGDEIKYLRSDEHGIKVEDIAKLFAGGEKRDLDFIRRALKSQLADQMKMFIASYL